MVHSNRREFIKTVGQGTLAAGMFLNLPEGAWLNADEAYAADGLGKEEYSREEKTIETEVLVVGGGIAGCFAAIKAKEQGADVVLVNKGYVGKSGQTPFAQNFMVFKPEWGHKLDAWMDDINRFSEYLNNRYWSETALTDSWDRYQDLLSWGIQFNKDKDGQPISYRELRGAVTEQLKFDETTTGHFGQLLRKQVIKSGVKVYEKVMVAELLKQDGRIVGAVGIPLESYDLYTFTAKATILCVGACSFKPAGYPPLVQLTCDGEAMAYRAGAEILGKEFVDTHAWRRASVPTMVGRRRSILGQEGGVTTDLEQVFGKKAAQPQAGPGRGGTPPGMTNAEGNPIPPHPAGVSQYGNSYLQNEFEAHAGRAPLGPADRGTVGGATLGMSLRKADGIWPANKDCASSIPGLYAAGDALGTMQNGAVYALLGSSLTGGAHTGTIAGVAAAKEASKMGKLTVNEKEIARAKQVVHGPIEHKGGYSPRWVTQLLQNTMMPYYISYVKKADRLQAAIPMVEFMQQHLVPKLFAREPHELRLAHETRNMVLSAEMRLRSALFRRESRGHHYREDFPRRDDPNWLAWSKIKEVQGKMTLIKVPMPKEMWPDLSIPYEKRYPYRYPGE